MILELSDDAMSLGAEFEEAVVGLARRGELTVLVYDTDKVIEVLQAGGIEDECNATEFFEFNILGAYVGPGTPYFCYNSW